MSAIRGIICPVVTPLTADEALDEAPFRRQLRRLAGKVDGVLALGTSGEAAWLSPATSRRVVEITLEELSGRAMVMVGIGDAGLKRTLANLERVLPGVDCVAVCSPYYYPLADGAQMADYFRRVVDACPVPVALYNIPQNTHQRIAPEVVEQLAAHGNIAGIKDSSGDLAYFAELLTLSSPRFGVLQGTVENRAAEILGMGADGYVSGLENIAPGTLRALRDALGRGDLAAAEALQARLTAVLGILSHGFWLACLKAAVAQLVEGPDRLASPLTALSRDAGDAVRRALVDLDLLPATAGAA